MYVNLTLGRCKYAEKQTSARVEMTKTCFITPFLLYPAVLFVKVILHKSTSTKLSLELSAVLFVKVIPTKSTADSLRVKMVGDVSAA